MSDSNFSLPTQIFEWGISNGLELEMTRRKLLDILIQNHYNYVHPPVFEKHDTLSIGSGADNNQRAFRFIDPLNGELLAIRTDISPQISRLDYSINAQKETIAKYCYAGQVATTHAEPLSVRNPYQIGAEIFGDNTINSDIEILNLAIKCCSLNNEMLLVDFGHSGILKSIISHFEFSQNETLLLLGVLKTKSRTDMMSFINRFKVNKTTAKLLEFLLSASCTPDTIDALGNNVIKYFPKCQQKWQFLINCYQQTKQKFPQIKWHIDIAELRGYSYHTGITFGIYNDKQLLCRGGRYNHDSSSQLRTATGFTLDLNHLISL